MAEGEAEPRIHQSPSFDQVASSEPSGAQAEAAQSLLKTSSSDSDLAQLSPGEADAWICSLCSYSNIKRTHCALCENPRESVTLFPIPPGSSSVSSSLSSHQLSGNQQHAVNQDNPVSLLRMESDSSLFDQFRSTTVSIQGILEEMTSLDGSNKGSRPSDEKHASSAKKDNSKQPTSKSEIGAGGGAGIAQQNTNDGGNDGGNAADNDADNAADNAADNDGDVHNDDDDDLSSRDQRREERRQQRELAKASGLAPVPTIYVLQQDEETLSQVTSHGVARAEDEESQGKAISSVKRRINYDELFHNLQQQQFESEDREAMMLAQPQPEEAQTQQQQGQSQQPQQQTQQTQQPQHQIQQPQQQQQPREEQQKQQQNSEEKFDDVVPIQDTPSNPLSAPRPRHGMDAAMVFTDESSSSNPEGFADEHEVEDQLVGNVLSANISTSNSKIDIENGLGNNVPSPPASNNPSVSTAVEEAKQNNFDAIPNNTSSTSTMLMVDGGGVVNNKMRRRRERYRQQTKQVLIATGVAIVIFLVAIVVIAIVVTRS